MPEAFNFKDLIVEVFVETSDGKGEIGTGYPVAPGRVITARHVLRPPGKTPAKAELRWYNQAGAIRERITVDLPAAICWEGGDSIDVAVLACDLPDALKNQYVRPSRTVPANGARWDSQGFARAGKRGDARPPVDMWGAFSRPATKAQQFTVGVDHSVRVEEDWKGASGGPVFVGADLIGILKTCPDNFNASRLDAIPCWRLLGDAEFCKALGIDEEDEAAREWAADRLHELFRANEAAFKALAGRLGWDDSHPMQIVADLLAPQSPTFDRLNTELAKIANEKKGEKGAPLLEFVRHLLGIVMPCRMGAGLIRSVLSQRCDGACVAVKAPIATPEGAEMTMAGCDQRPARFRVVTDDKDPANRLLKAILRLEPQPEGGIDPAGDHFVRQFEDHLIDLTGVAGSQMPNLGVAHAALAELAAEELGIRAQEQQETFYFLYPLPEAADSQRRFEENVRRLRQGFDTLIFILLSGDSQQYQREWRAFRPLRTIWGANKVL